MRLLLAATLLVVAGCVGPADPDPAVRQRLATAAAPLVAVHERLDAYADVVAAGDHDTAVQRWPGTAEAVTGLLASYDPRDADALGPAERSALTGYLGGVRAGVQAWERVAEVLVAGRSTDDVEPLVAAAQDHMRRLDRLRRAVVPDISPD